MANSLQIRQLSKNGELIATINCLPGKVTVFRSDSPEELIAFQRVLSGVKGPERFAVLLGEATFDPHANCLIGFGEGFSEDIPLKDFLVNSGIAAETLRVQLNSYGLEADKDKLLSSLNECAKRRAQILAAIFSNKPVMILNDPFGPISSIWRERFAELLLQDAVNNGRIVVVVSLTQRPQSWISNDSVVRVHVGTNVQKTIGFAGGTDEVNELVKQFRKSLKTAQPAEFVKAKPSEPTSVEAPPVDSAIEASQVSIVGGDITSRKASPQKKFFHFKPIYAGSLAVGLVLLLLVFDKFRPTAGSPANSNHQNNASMQPASVATDSKLVPDVAPAGVAVLAKVEDPKPSLTEIPPQFLLDTYPKDISDSIVLAFNEQTGDVANSQPAVISDNATGVVVDASNPFNGVQSSEDSSDSPPQVQNNSLPWANQAGSEGSADEEDRRRQIRDKFLEAIRKAAEQRQQVNY